MNGYEFTIYFLAIMAMFILGMMQIRSDR